MLDIVLRKLTITFLLGFHLHCWPYINKSKVYKEQAYSVVTSVSQRAFLLVCFPTRMYSLNLEVCYLKCFNIKTHDILSHKTTNIIAKAAYHKIFLALKSPTLCVYNYCPTYSHSKLPGTFICLAVWPCNTGIKFHDCIESLGLTWCCNNTKSCNLGTMATQWLGLGYTMAICLVLQHQVSPEIWLIRR